MERIIDQNTKVSDIVIKVPLADKVLKEYRIDFCCGGNRPLQEVISERNLPGEEILSKIHAIYVESVENEARKTNDWVNANYQTLINHIIQTHHQYLVNELPQLSIYTTKLLRVHGDTHPELAEVHKLFHELKLELEHHLIKEERDVFPHIVNYEKTLSKDHLKTAVLAIEELESEHEKAGDVLKALREVTSDFVAPGDACTTYQLTYQKLEALESDLFQHIHLENNILFPRIMKEMNK